MHLLYALDHLPTCYSVKIGHFYLCLAHRASRNLRCSPPELGDICFFLCVYIVVICLPLPFDAHSSCPLRPSQLLIQDVGLDSVALATLVMKGALGESEVDPSIGEAFQWWVPGGGGPLFPTAVARSSRSLLALPRV